MIHFIDRFTEHLRKGRYNQATIKAYRDAIYLFYNANRDVPQSKLSEELVSSYLLDLKSKKNYSDDAVIQAGKALKLYFKTIFEKNLSIKATGEKQDKLPDILTKDEVIKLINHIKNKKHKSIICLIYGFGLKLNEILELKISNINFETNKIEIGDINDYSFRKLTIPDVLKEYLHYLISVNKGSEYLISGNGESKYSPRGVQLFFSKAVEELSFEKDISVQTLRHSYAVHLLETGLDIHYLQQLLGHKYLQTTSMYQGYINFRTEDVKSPIIELF